MRKHSSTAPQCHGGSVHNKETRPLGQDEVHTAILSHNVTTQGTEFGYHQVMSALSGGH